MDHIVKETLSLQSYAALAKMSMLHERSRMQFFEHLTPLVFESTSINALIVSVAITILFTSMTAIAVTTAMPVIVPIILAAASLCSLIWTIYEVYSSVYPPPLVDVESTTEQEEELQRISTLKEEFKEWDVIFDAILEGHFGSAVQKLEDIACKFGTRDGNRHRYMFKAEILDIRHGKLPMYHAYLMSYSLLLEAAGRAQELSSNPNEVAKIKEKIHLWTSSMRCGNDVEKKMFKIFDAVVSEQKNCSIMPIKNYKPLLLLKILDEVEIHLDGSEEQQKDPKYWNIGWGGYDVRTPKYLQATAPYINKESVGEENFRIFQEMLNSKDLRELYYATKKLNREDLILRAKQSLENNYFYDF